MDKLADRLDRAMEIGDATRGDLIAVCKVSPQAASKWFTGDSANLKAVHAFAIAKRCKVSAEWLATGRGKAVPDGQPPPPEFEPKHVDLLRMYKRLPDEVRSPIRQMIETLAAAQREGYVTWANTSKERGNV